MLIKTDYGYDYRGVSITRTSKGDFTYGKIFPNDDFVRPVPMKLTECKAEIDNYLDNKGATVERYRIKVAA